MTKRSVNVVEERLDIEERVLGWMLSQFNESENLQAINKVLAAELQEIESDAVIPLLDMRTISEAEGQQLDNIGELLKSSRRGMTDNQYRAMLSLVALRRSCDGTHNSILGIIRQASGDELATLVSGLLYSATISFNFCLGDARSQVVAQPPFGFKGNPSAAPFGTGKFSAIQIDEGLVQQMIIDEIVAMMPLQTGIRIKNKSDKPFGFKGNPHATGFSSSTGITDTLEEEVLVLDFTRGFFSSFEADTAGASDGSGGALVSLVYTNIPS